MTAMIRSFAFVLGLLALAACSSQAPITPGEDTVPATGPVDFERVVRPVLADALGSDGASYAAVMAAGPSGFVVPFDAEGSLLVRFAEDLPADASVPFPGLRQLDGAALATVKRWIEEGARPAPDGMPGYGDATDLLMVGVQGENHVAILDADSHRLIRRVYLDDHGLPSRPYGPHHFAFEPDGSAWYASLVSAGVVVKLRLDLMMDPSDPAYVLGRTPDDAFVTPGMLALDASSNRIYVGRSTLSDPLASGFGVLDRESMAYEVVATPFNVPHAMTVTPDGRYALTAELTGDQSRSRIAVYDAQSEDLTLVDVPVGDGGAREFIHFSILGAHHMGGMDHSGMDHSGMATYPYTATLTSRATNEVLFFELAEDGTLTMTDTRPAGEGPYHAHASHDGSALIIPDQRGNTVTILDAASREPVTVVANAGANGPLSQPHSPAPGFAGDKFFVTNSNLQGAWTPSFLFRSDGAPGEAPDFGNVAVYDMDGTLLEVIQLGHYPSGVEPVRIPAMDHDQMDHGEMDHGQMDHSQMDHSQMDHSQMDHDGMNP